MLTMRPTAATERDLMSRLDTVRNMARPQPDLVQKLQRAILDGFAENFDSESAGGVKWAALAESTILDRLSQGYGAGPILQRSGDYMSSWLDTGNAEHVHEIEQLAGGWQLNEGSQHPLAGIHEEGGDIIPARPVAELSLASEDDIREAAENWILTHLQR